MKGSKHTESTALETGSGQLGHCILKQLLDTQHEDLNSISITHTRIPGLVASAQNPRAGEVGTSGPRGLVH